jgi:hypothetical protein
MNFLPESDSLKRWKRARCSKRPSLFGTAMHFAALHGQLDIFDALVKKGADVNEKEEIRRSSSFWRSPARQTRLFLYNIGDKGG